MKTYLTELLFPLIAVVAAFLVGGIIVWMVGDSPLLVYELFFTSAFGSVDGIGYTLFYATPLIFTGLAVAVAFKCGLLNIGAEGQLIAAAFAAAWGGLGRGRRTSGDGRGSRGRRSLVRHPRTTQGEVWRSRSDHYNNDELHCRRPGQLFDSISLSQDWRSDSRDPADCGKGKRRGCWASHTENERVARTLWDQFPGSFAPEPGVPTRACCMHSRLRFFVEDKVGLRAARGWHQCFGGRVRRHLDRAQHRDRDVYIGNACGNGRNK